MLNIFFVLLKEERQLDFRYEKMRQHYAERIRDAIRKHLPRLEMLHSEVEKAVFPLPHDMVRLEVYRRSRRDRAKLNVNLEKLEARKRKRKLEDEIDGLFSFT